MPRRRAAAATTTQPVEYYALDNSLLRSKSTGIHLRTKPSILENDLSTPMIKWETIIRGVRYVPDVEAVTGPEADEAVKEAGISLRDTYGRTIPITEEPKEWLVVKGIRNLRGKFDGVTRPWYIPFDITGVPVLLEKHAIYYEDEDDQDEEEDEVAKKRYEALTKPTNRPPFELGRGMNYEVVYEAAVVRAAPSLGAVAQSKEMKGAIVEMFDWDETRQWRSVYDRNHRVGWMLLDHPEFGALLRPRCLPYQVRPVEPMVAAVLEADVRWLKDFIKAGMDVNVKDAGERTPFMVAAEYGRHGPIVVLCAAGADPGLYNFQDQTAVDVAKSQVTKALIQALTTDKHFDSELCQEAIESLAGDVRELAEDMVGRKITRMRFFQSQDKKPATSEAKKAAPRPSGAPAQGPSADEEDDMAKLEEAHERARQEAERIAAKLQRYRAEAAEAEVNAA